MTYEEFKEIIEKSGEYQVSDERTTGIIVFKEECSICYISKTRIFGIDTIYSGNEDFLEEYGDTMLEFAQTPTKYRYPVKKYYVKLDLSEVIYMQNRYLNKVNYAEYPEINYKLDSRYQNSEHQTQFTMEEIKEIIPKEDTDKFKFIPVEED